MTTLTCEMMNAVSDVMMNRPAPIREIDQIYMKAGNLALQADYIAQRYQNLRVLFVGDGDAIALSIAYLASLGLIEDSPLEMHVVDFDERIVRGITRFSDKHGLTAKVGAELYNVVDALPADLVEKYDAFYCNPPWGASNDGESVRVFMERGIEGTRGDCAQGTVVIGDDFELDWTQEVLQVVQGTALNAGFVVSEMVPSIHNYHLDDNPELRSCNLMLRRVQARTAPPRSRPLERERFERFYGENSPLDIRYIREVPDVNVGRAPESTYKVELLEDEG